MKRLSSLAAPLLVLLSGCAAAPTPPPTALTSVQASHAPASGDDAVRAALGGSVRTEKERARDGARHPLETLAFFGVRADSTVVELWPGGGYYTAILAPVVAEHGKLTVTHFDPNGDPKSEDTMEAREILGRLAKEPAAFGKVARQQLATSSFSLGPDASADVVLTFRNVHNWIEQGYAEKVFAAAFRVLKPGGVLGIEEHRGRPGMTTKEIRDTGYVPEDVVLRLATDAGFRLADRSEVNANPKDTKDYPQGVWSLPPSFAERDANHAKYAAIGESDRMTLKLVKP